MSSSQEVELEEIYVLYGSQMGNSEQAAKDFCSQVGAKLSPDSIRKMTKATASSNYIKQIKATHMQLDDFLERKKCAWTKLVVIITSSYGVGQAPLGCYKFRELCDEWLRQYGEDRKHDNRSVLPLDGLNYAMCGLGDSKFTTFFENPSTIDKALTRMGASRIGELGKADASGTGSEEQIKVITNWIDNIWVNIANVLIEPDGTATADPEQLAQIQKYTLESYQKIRSDNDNDDDGDNEKKPILVSQSIFFAVLGAVVAMIIYASKTNNNN